MKKNQSNVNSLGSRNTSELSDEFNKASYRSDALAHPHLVIPWPSCWSRGAVREAALLALASPRSLVVAAACDGVSSAGPQ